MNPPAPALVHRQLAILARHAHKPEPDSQVRGPAKRPIEDRPPVIFQDATASALPTILSSDQPRHILQSIVILFRQNHGNHPPHLLFASRLTSPHPATTLTPNQIHFAPRRRRHRPRPNPRGRRTLSHSTTYSTHQSPLPP